MLRRDADSAKDGSSNHVDGPSLNVMASTIANWSPAISPRAHSFDSIVPYRYQQPIPPPPSTSDEFWRRSNSSSSSSSARNPSALSQPQPQAILNMGMIQAQAEMLEMQTRRDLEDSQRATERHVEEMLDSKGFRVSHACEHCRQRKAKCSGTQPCQRCAKQSILCVYSRHERKGKMLGPMNTLVDIVSQPSSSSFPSSSSSLRHPTHGEFSSMSGMNIGPKRADKHRNLRYANMTVPYGLRRNTAPCTPMVGYTSREVASTSSTTSSTTNVVPPPFGSNIMAPFHTTSREQRGVGTFYGGQQQQGGMHLPQVIRPTPLRYSSSHLNSISSFVVGMGEERRDSTATEASFTSSFAYGPPLQHMQFQIQPGNRPWTTGSSLPLALAHSMNEHDSTSNTPSFRFNSMLNESSDPSSALSRAQNSSSTSTLNSIWTDTNVEASSLTTAQRPVRPPPPSPPPPLFDVPRPRTFFNEQEEILRECTPGGATQSSHNELRAGLGADHGETASQELRQW